MIKLENGEQFDPYRKRSLGRLSAGELQACQRYQIPLAYDPVQEGWVASTFVDDIDEPDHLRLTLDKMRPALGAVLSELLDELESGGIPREVARERALAAGVKLCQSPHMADDPDPLDKCHIALQREIARFIPAMSEQPGAALDGRIEYRPWHSEDAAVYQRILGNENIWKYLPEQAPESMSLETARDMIALANEGRHHTVRAVLVDGEIVGQVRLLHNRGYPDLRGAEVAYLIAEEHWGRGLMTHILADYTRHAFETEDLDFIKAWIHPENTGSIKAATRAGYLRDNFPYEGHLSVLRARAGFQRYLCFNVKPD
jgi:RimJ/RimL family protein N-acetyltransferase